MLWGHDRVVDMAVSGFRRRALTLTAVVDPAPTPKSRE